jgi:nucleotide-binding universal stress UspA family protein
MLRTRRLLDRATVALGGAAAPSVLPAGSPTTVLGQKARRMAARAIVAGYDGSQVAQAAVVEAGLRAGPRGCVFVVYAYDSPPALLGWPYYNRRLMRARAIGHQALADLLMGEIWLPEAEYIPELIAGKPEDVIARVAAARHADTVVVGACSAGRVRAKRLSVSQELKRTLRVPVITTHQ